MLEKLPTRLNLEKRGITVLSNMCPLCNKVEEIAQHVFINCEIAKKVWDNCDRWIGISFARHHTIVNHFQQFYLSDFNRKINEIWKGVCVAILWEIWKHRNKVVFNNGVVDDIEIFTLAHVKAWSWVKFKWHKVNYSASEWFLCPFLNLGSII